MTTFVSANGLFWAVVVVTVLVVAVWLYAVAVIMIKHNEKTVVMTPDQLKIVTGFVYLVGVLAIWYNWDAIWGA